MTDFAALKEWDAHLSDVADSSQFIVCERFEEADGQMLARVLANEGWPRYSADRMYAKADDDSNRALRRLQSKYHAALERLAEAGSPEHLGGRQDV